MTRPANAYQHPSEPLIDWSKAPVWATSAVMNSAGIWFWIRNPDAYAGLNTWCACGELDTIAGIGISPAQNWRNSKVMRPVTCASIEQSLGRANREPAIDWSTAPEDATHYDKLRNWFVNVDDCTGLVCIFDGEWQPRCWLHRDTVTGNPDRFVQHPDDVSNEDWLQSTITSLDDHLRQVKTSRTGTLKIELPNPQEWLSLPLTGNYGSLASVLGDAFDQAARGKGAERHGQDKPFDDQPMQQIIELFGEGFALGQAAKKMQEAQRLGHYAAERELLGAINYIAGAIIHRRKNEAVELPF